MRVISFINLKGGVGKSVSSINFAHILSTQHDYRVLLVDNDKQGNTSEFFGLHDYQHPSVSDILTKKNYRIAVAIRRTAYEHPGILPANRLLRKADKEILLDSVRPQQTRLHIVLQQVADQYNFAVIDNAPDLSISVINALVATDDVMIPIKIDNFSFDGVDQILGCVEDIREFNGGIRVAGGFVTMYERSNVNRQGGDDLEARKDLPMLSTRIRKAVMVNETTFQGVPIVEYAGKSNTAKEHLDLVAEYLS